MGWKSWSTVLPSRICVGAGTEFTEVFLEFCKSVVVPVAFAGTESHWQQGNVEIHGCVWKEAFNKLASLHPLSVRDFGRIARGFAATNSARNSRHRHHGFSPIQWALGFTPPLPSSLLESPDSLAAHQTVLLEDSPFKERLQMAAHAERALLEVDNDYRIRRALVGKSGLTGVCSSSEHRSISTVSAVRWERPTWSAPGLAQPLCCATQETVQFGWTTWASW